MKWYTTVFPATAHLISLLHQKREDKAASLPPIGSTSRPRKKQKPLFRIFNILKSGFYSTSEEVVTVCGMLFIRVAFEVNQAGGELVGDTWDWFVTATALPQPSPKKRLPIHSPYSHKKGKGGKGEPEVEEPDYSEYMLQTGL